MTVTVFYLACAAMAAFILWFTGMPLARTWREVRGMEVPDFASMSEKEVTRSPYMLKLMSAVMSTLAILVIAGFTLHATGSRALHIAHLKKDYDSKAAGIDAGGRMFTGGDYVMTGHGPKHITLKSKDGTFTIRRGLQERYEGLYVSVDVPDDVHDGDRVHVPLPHVRVIGDRMLWIKIKPEEIK